MQLFVNVIDFIKYSFIFFFLVFKEILEIFILLLEQFANCFFL